MSIEREGGSPCERMRRALGAVEVGKLPSLAVALPVLREGLDGDRALAYRIAEDDAGRRVDFVYSVGFGPNRLVERALQDYVPRAPERFLSYVPSNPAQALRNVARIADERDEAPMYTELLGRLGVSRSHRLRVLLHDGELLAWVGVFRDRLFEEDEARTLETCVPLLRDRLALERRLDSAWLHEEALRASLAAIAGPAFLLSATGAIVQANDAGRAVLEADRGGVLAALRAGREEPPDPSHAYRLTEIARRGALTHYLAVRRAGSSSAERLGLAARRWGLTRRQVEVLSELAEGHQNRTIAERFGVSIGTVELHVSALLQKSGCEGRAELVARFFNLW